jgi:hypothetical protein
MELLNIDVDPRLFHVVHGKEFEASREYIGHRPTLFYAIGLVDEKPINLDKFFKRLNFIV